MNKGKKPWRPFRGPDVMTDVLHHNVVTDGAGNHPTVKPSGLMEQLIRFGCPDGGLVLDPFIGSGTTAVAAFLGGFRCIGIDNNEEYLSHAAERLRLGDEGLAQVVEARRADARQETLW